MKKVIILIILAFQLPVSAKTFYVATNGNDSNPGSFEKPWATWGKAFTSNSVKAGDTVYFRGGVYNITVTDGTGYDVSRAGTSNAWIVYANYPGEVPILDCSAADAGSGSYNNGIGAGTLGEGANYIKFKGLTVRNLYQLHDDHRVYCNGFSCSNGFFIVENCTAYRIEGCGFASQFYNGWPIVNGEHYFINCDAWDCWNPTNPPGYLPGNAGVGFASENWYGTEGHAYVKGCRAWKCGDQGFSWNGEHYCEADSCWSFNNGLLEGDGHGFKLGWHDRNYGGVNVVVRNCIAAYNRASGMTTNDADRNSTPMNIYNNTAYHNGYMGDGWNYTCGFVIYNSPDEWGTDLLRTFKNNISYDNEGGDVYEAPHAEYTHSYNSWDIPLTLRDADFVSVDSTGLAGPRKADGSLPDLDFLKLSPASRAIDAGVDVGLPYYGKAPDLGYSEFISGAYTPSSPIYVSSSIENDMPARLEIIYNLNLANIIPSVTSFDVKVNFVTRTVNSITISGTKVLLKLDSPVSYSDVVTVSYTKPPNNPLQTITGGKAASIDAQNVTNNVMPIVPVYLSSVIENVTPTRLEMTYSLPLANIVPSASAFKVRINSSSRSVSSVSISGTKVLLILSSPVVYGDVVTVSYTKPENNPLQTTVGGQATSINNKSVTNNCLYQPENILIKGIIVSGKGSSNTIDSENGTLQLTAAITPANATNKNITWSILNETGQASISTSGMVTAISKGTVIAKAMANDGSGTYGTLIITILAQSVLVDSIEVYPSNNLTPIIDKKDGTLQFEARIFPENVSNSTIKWSVENESGSAIIDDNGLVTANSEGFVKVIAKATDGSKISGFCSLAIINQSLPTNLNIRSEQGVSIIQQPDNLILEFENPNQNLDHCYVYSILGNLILQERIFNNHIEIDKSNLPSGIYIISLIGGQQRLSFKVLITR